jgi:hypothetical protein
MTCIMNKGTKQKPLKPLIYKENDFVDLLI